MTGSTTAVIQAALNALLTSAGLIDARIEKLRAKALTTGGCQQFLGIYASMQMPSKHMFLEQIPHALSLGVRDEESLQIGFPCF